MSDKNDKSVFQPSTLWLTEGKENQSVADYISTQAQDFSALLYWLEPALQLNTDNSTGRLKDFAPLGKEKLPDLKYKLEAAYLFGLYHNLPVGLHVIATKNGCRWCRFQTWQSADSEEIPVHERNSYPVLARHDFKRFFGDKNRPSWSQAIGKLKVTEYWTDTGLLVWWLSEGKV